MSLIIGLIHEGEVWMGSDSAASADGQQDILACPKQFRKGEFLIGACGTIRLTQVLQFHFDPPEHLEGRDTYEYMVRDFVPVLRECVKEQEAILLKDGVTQMDGALLVAYKGRLFEIQDGFQVSENALPYTCVGSAYPNAYGALWALEEVDAGGEEAVRIALEAGERFVMDVARPFHIEKL